MEMLGDGNYAGVIDQIGILETEGCGLAENERNECAYMLAMALYERGDAECVSRLRDVKPRTPARPDGTPGSCRLFLLRRTIRPRARGIRRDRLFTCGSGTPARIPLPPRPLDGEVRAIQRGPHRI